MNNNTNSATKPIKETDSEEWEVISEENEEEESVPTEIEVKTKLDTNNTKSKKKNTGEARWCKLARVKGTAKHAKIVKYLVTLESDDLCLAA